MIVNLFRLYCLPLGVVVLVAILAVKIVLEIVLIVKRGRNQRKNPNAPKGPTPLPLLGSLHLLGNRDIPFSGFTDLMPKYGNIFALKMGESECVVVNSVELRDEVLNANQKGDDFDARPNFERIQRLFGGNKDNALAFCDFSPLQKLRRELMHKFTFTYSHSELWHEMNKICMEEGAHMIQQLRDMASPGNKSIDVKMTVLKTCGNIFNRYFCGVGHTSYDDPKFHDYIKSFDEVFWEVNTGRLSDFIPWFISFECLPLRRAQKASLVVKDYVDNDLVEATTHHDSPMSFLDILRPYLNGSMPEMDSQTATYCLEDILGGHSAVGCMVLRILKDISENEDVQKKIKEELEQVKKETGHNISSLENASLLHWTRAAIFETIRMTCSPIVPHKAIRDSSIGDMNVEKDTVVFINNHHLHFSKELWGSDTEVYDPTRFLKQCEHSGSLIFMRPIHFKPFSLGKRSCMGYKLVESLTLSLLSNILESFSLSPAQENWKIPVGLLGLPDEPFRVKINFE
uniref:Cytochrome P450 CYP307E1 n=1 Tax=Tigriopus kingsejongensis TaxID=1133412 RepID=A0A2H4FY65_9MAXI|nr:cytochrome P450 CYP307E1 [Tigriopus kingsejongensis]